MVIMRLLVVYIRGVTVPPPTTDKSDEFRSPLCSPIMKGWMGETPWGKKA
jgi:hypothetical protein